MASDTSSHAAKAEEALRLLLAGDSEAGIDLYRQSLAGDRLPNVPIGMHLLFLRRAGRAESAARLLRLAVARGANVAAKAGGFGADVAEAAAEYEGLFAEGIINSRMILDYLRVLAELGRGQELSAILDPDRLLRMTKLDARLAEAVEALLLDLEDQSEQQDAVQSVRNQRMVRDFTSLDHPAARSLAQLLEAEVRSYLRDWAASDHPFAGHVAPDFRIRGWGLVSRGSGYNIPHIHQQGWATGVFYPTNVDGPGGELRIGRPQNAAGSDEEWADRTIRPERGLLVLIPSFYTHWTVPLGAPGLRTSVAFDVLPLESELVSPAGFEPATY